MALYLRGLIVATSALGCSSHAISPSSTAAPPSCIRAEATDHTSGIQEFSFDTDGNLTTIAELDNAGKELARTTVNWSTTSIAVARSGAFASRQRGVLGQHGELVEWTTGAEHVELHWDGTFAPVATPPRARFAFETYYHVVGDEPLLPLDTSWRGVWPRMRAFVFTGTVSLHRDGAPETADTRATYERGHQIERSIGGRHGRPRITTKTVWRGDEPVEQTGSDEARRTFSSARGHVTGITGDVTVAFTYDGENLTRVRTEGAADVAVSRCESPTR
jgi:hypothetical protein